MEAPPGASSTGTAETAALPPELARRIVQRIGAAVGIGDVSELDLLAAELSREPSPGPHYGGTIGLLAGSWRRLLRSWAPAPHDPPDSSWGGPVTRPYEHRALDLRIAPSATGC